MAFDALTAGHLDVEDDVDVVNRLAALVTRLLPVALSCRARSFPGSVDIRLAISRGLLRAFTILLRQILGGDGFAVLAK